MAERFAGGGGLVAFGSSPGARTDVRHVAVEFVHPVIVGKRALPALSGGTFQNRRLLERAAASLSAAGLDVLVPERLPPGDGGISYGQAAVAAARLARGGSD